MKRITILFISILSLVLVMLLPIQAAEFDLVADGVGVLTDDEYFELNELAQDITEQYQCEVSIVIIEDKGDGNITEFAKYFYEEYGYGYGANKSGLMLLISMKERDYVLRAYGYGNTAFTDHGKDVLADKYLLPMLGKNNYYSAFSIYLNKTAEFLKMAENGTPFDSNSPSDSLWIKLVIVMLVPLLIAGVVCFIFLRQMKTAVPQRAADSYIPNGGFNLTMQADQFLFKTETRTRIEESSTGTSVGSDGSSNKQGKF
ncbi:MAG TPA: TPM domain-containing protein [Epulopiscium sp.]|nr:TPM domain-containing protein [Candidatus Epulonipiscium sp.]